MLKRPDGAMMKWFDIGVRFFECCGHDPEHLPPLRDREAQRAWLAGFGTAWCEWPERRLDTFDDPRDGSLIEALAHTLNSHPQFMRTLLTIQQGGGNLH
jgi:hypothetical protein